MEDLILNKTSAKEELVCLKILLLRSNQIFQITIDGEIIQRHA